MSTSETLGALLAVALTAGMLGGMLTAGLVEWARTRWPKLLVGSALRKIELPVELLLRTNPVGVRVQVQQPEPLTVEVATTGSPTQREIALRVLGVWPDVGPSDLAAVAGCSKSTAHAIIGEFRAGKLGRETSGEVQGEAAAGRGGSVVVDGTSGVPGSGVADRVGRMGLSGAGD